ncbi:hypothetical protein [Neisseria chenwenguii]|uniref:Uncharacterized protein n=1 Tax=Neisseria chenwenguii TaxID=1853278 RepID=A0A220S1Q2_9NEIS|nr:hypothetical protein [Neisseria chenwenguii]ASK27115.1 hypothetical protein BG910_04600 [Neisseria chenwenguii]ROV54866.1 hypothetical protein EGS38_10280 [Neisseria chenwenguii]
MSLVFSGPSEKFADGLVWVFFQTAWPAGASKRRGVRLRRFLAANRTYRFLEKVLGLSGVWASQTP